MNLGDRMKRNYENRAKTSLIRRTPVIMRLDGKAFHTLTKDCERPFDAHLSNSMTRAAIDVFYEVQGAKCAYIQSDEISILITDNKRLGTEAWFDYNVQKMTSIAASVCSVAFTEAFRQKAHFDCRVFNIPEAEVCNYFIWRQKDWERNSLFMFANSFFSAKQLHEKKKADIHEMLHGIGQNWANLQPAWKNGTFGRKIPVSTTVMLEFDDAPILTECREVIEDLLIPEEE